MIVLTKGATQNIILTLTEKQLLVDPNYLFVFTGRTTNTQVKFIKLNNTDTSLYKDRYNKFQFIVNDLFPNREAEEFVYNVYEQASAVNTDPTGLNLLETGICLLNEASNEVFTQPTVTTEFKI